MLLFFYLTLHFKTRPKPKVKEKKETIIALLEEAYKLRVSNLKRSKELCKEGLTLSIEIDDKALIGKSLNLLSLFSMIMGDHQHSLEMAQEAIVYFEALGDEKGIADAKYNIASINYKTDNYHLGLVNLIDCITIYRKFHDYHYAVFSRTLSCCQKIEL